MSDTEELPPAKRLKLEHLETDDHNGKNVEANSAIHEEIIPNRTVINPVSKLESIGSVDQGNPSSSQFNYVTAEELQNLRQFQVLDEVNEEDSKDEDSDASDKTEELPDDEIERMLEEDLPEGFKGAPKPKEKSYITRQKIVLEEKGINHFEVLPLDWMMVRHCSGMPVYMHRATRVCTLSKPYFLGKGNTRRHDIPISAIPCLAYRKALEEEEKQKEIDKSIAEQIANGTWANSNHQTNQTDQNNKSNDKELHSNTPDSTDSHVTGDMEPMDNQSGPQVTVNGASNTNADVEIQNKKSDSIMNEYTEIRDVDTCSVNKEPIETDNMAVCPVSKEPTESADAAECLVNKEPPKAADVDVCPVNKELSETGNVTTHPVNKEPTNTGDMAEDPTETDDMAVCPVNKEPTKTGDVSECRVNKEPSETGNVSECPINKELSETGNVGVCPVNKDMASRKPVVLPGGIVMPPPRVETVNTSWKTQHLSHEQLNDYCKKLFKFKNVNIMHFKRWADRRKYVKARKTLQYPTLPEGTKLITIPAQNTNGQDNGKATKRDWVMNMNGCSYLSVFHEYVRRALQKQPVYEFKQLENAASPYQATVYIGGMQYGVGLGSSKRQAKSAAARASIHILIPEMKDELDGHAARGQADTNAEPDFSFFDYVGIEDPRIQEFCAATSEPSPHAILRTCLLRNFGAGDRHIHTEMKKLEYQKIELTMKVGKHSATVTCKNKKQAKQRASQAILQALHPHIRSWGSLLRLYGSRSVKSCKEKKIEEQQITLLQDKAQQNEPNYAVLEKLRNEMRKLKERDEAVVPIGTLMMADDLPTHSGSMLNNVDL